MRNLALSLFMAAVSFSALNAQQAASVDVPAGARVLLQAKGEGVQVYTCNNASGALKWMLTAPDAKLSNAAGKLIGTHFAGPTWKLEDGGQVQGQLIASAPSAEADSVAWLLLRAKAGTATGSLGDVAFIRRTETHGGVAPQTGCADPADAGKTARIPYTAAYTFYAAQ